MFTLDFLRGIRADYSGQRGSGRTLTKRSASSGSWCTSSRNHHRPAYHTASVFRASMSAKTLACASVTVPVAMVVPGYFVAAALMGTAGGCS